MPFPQFYTILCVILTTLFTHCVELNNTRVWVKTSTPYVEYLVDAATLLPVRGDPYWRDAAEQRIEDTRKNDVTIK